MKYRIRRIESIGVKSGRSAFYIVEQKGWFFWTRVNDLLYLTQKDAEDDIEIFLKEYES